MGVNLILQMRKGRLTRVMVNRVRKPMSNTARARSRVLKFLISISLHHIQVIPKDLT